MLVGALRSDNPLGGAPLICDDAAETFALQGIGEISAAKLLDFENRRQLVWSDLVTREWVLETAAMRVQREAAARAVEAAATAAANAAAVAAADARTMAEADGVGYGEHARVPGTGPGRDTLIFAPPGPAGPSAVSASGSPDAAARRPAGVPAATTRFAAPADDGRLAGRLVWSEELPDEDAASGDGAAADAGATPAGALVPAAQGDERKALALTTAWTPPLGAPDGPRQAGAPGRAIVARQAAPVTRRAERRRSLQKAEHRRRLSAVSGRAVVVALLVVAVAVVVLLAQHGGF